MWSSWTNGAQKDKCRSKYCKVSPMELQVLRRTAGSAPALHLGSEPGAGAQHLLGPNIHLVKPCFEGGYSFEPLGMYMWLLPCCPMQQAGGIGRSAVVGGRWRSPQTNPRQPSLSQHKPCGYLPTFSSSAEQDKKRRGAAQGRESTWSFSRIGRGAVQYHHPSKGILNWDIKSRNAAGSLDTGLGLNRTCNMHAVHMLPVAFSSENMPWLQTIILS